MTGFIRYIIFVCYSPSHTHAHSLPMFVFSWEHENLSSNTTIKDKFPKRDWLKTAGPLCHFVRDYFCHRKTWRHYIWVRDPDKAWGRIWQLKRCRDYRAETSEREYSEWSAGQYFFEYVRVIRAHTFGLKVTFKPIYLVPRRASMGFSPVFLTIIDSQLNDENYSEQDLIWKPSWHQNIFLKLVTWH